MNDELPPRPGRGRALSHLAVRFLRALWPRRPRASDRAWVTEVLEPAELALWERQPAHDQRHTIGVARGVAAMLDETVYAGDPTWLAAALLHDIGKLDAALGVYGRVVATVAGVVAGRDMAPAWAGRRGFTRRVGLYLQHGAIGSELVRVAGGRELVAAWAGAHHRRDQWAALPIPPTVIRALVLSDAD